MPKRLAHRCMAIKRIIYNPKGTYGVRTIYFCQKPINIRRFLPCTMKNTQIIANFRFKPLKITFATRIFKVLPQTQNREFPLSFTGSAIDFLQRAQYKLYVRVYAQRTTRSPAATSYIGVRHKMVDLVYMFCLICRGSLHS